MSHFISSFLPALEGVQGQAFVLEYLTVDQVLCLKLEKGLEILQKFIRVIYSFYQKFC